LRFRAVDKAALLRSVIIIISCGSMPADESIKVLP
jgi:hypothetical protein